MSKNKMPPELLEHFKKKMSKGSEDKQESDKSKRAEALSKAKTKIEEKNAKSKSERKETS
jgi:hypothetical protein